MRMDTLSVQVQNAYHTYTKCLDVADALSSITTRMDTQLDEFVKAVQSDPKLAKGFHLMGNSQGRASISWATRMLYVKSVLPMRWKPYSWATRSLFMICGIVHLRGCTTTRLIIGKNEMGPALWKNRVFLACEDIAELKG